MSCLNSDAREDMFDMLMGTLEKADSKGGIPSVKHVTAKTLFAMTDDQRMELYNKIVSDVMSNK